MSVTTITRPEFDYTTIEDPLKADLLRNRAEEISGLRRGIEANVIEIGKQLLAAKEEIPHGQFTAWCEQALNFSQRTATRLMKIAAEFNQIGHGGRFGISVLEQLAAAPDPQAALVEATTLAANGQPVTKTVAAALADKPAATPANPDLDAALLAFLRAQSEPVRVLDISLGIPYPEKTLLPDMIEALKRLIDQGMVERERRPQEGFYYRALPEVSAPADAPEVTSLDPAQSKAQRLADEMLAYLRANPPQRFMDIFTHVGKNTRQSDMGATIDALIAAGQIEKVTGEYGERRYRALPVTDEAEVGAVAVEPEPELDPEIARHSRTITNAQYEMLKAVYQGNPLKRDAPSRTALINRGLIKNLGMGERWEFDKIELTDLGRAVVEYTIESANTMAPFPPADPEPDGAAEVFAGYGIDPDEAEPVAAESPDDQPGEAVSAPPDTAISTLVARAARALRKYGQGMYFNEIRHFMRGADNRKVNHALSHGVQIGVLVKDPARNYYTLPEFAARAQSDPDPNPITDSAHNHLIALLESVKTAETAAKKVTEFSAQESWSTLDANTLKDARRTLSEANTQMRKAQEMLLTINMKIGQFIRTAEQPEAVEVHA